MIILSPAFEVALKVHDTVSKLECIFEYSHYTISCGRDIIAKTCDSSDLSTKIGGTRDLISSIALLADLFALPPCSELRSFPRNLADTSQKAKLSIGWNCGDMSDIASLSNRSNLDF
jgi:hypothetical protein